MNERADGQDLLRIARDELLKRLLPELPGSLRYQALMIANAMAIASREFELEHTSNLREQAGLQALLGQSDPERAGSGNLRDALQAGRKQLCQDIRAGKFDQASDALLQFLLATTADRLAISNPRLLRPEGGR